MAVNPSAYRSVLENAIHSPHMVSRVQSGVSSMGGMPVEYLSPHTSYLTPSYHYPPPQAHQPIPYNPHGNNPLVHTHTGGYTPMQHAPDVQRYMHSNNYPTPSRFHTPSPMPPSKTTPMRTIGASMLSTAAPGATHSSYERSYNTAVSRGLSHQGKDTPFVPPIPPINVLSRSHDHRTRSVNEDINIAQQLAPFYTSSAPPNVVYDVYDVVPRKHRSRLQPQKPVEAWYPLAMWYVSRE
eukprot:GHVO01052337.1.p1 GENE.GHVO01052337.1~~GHVO01052337.1.p1  ORF type:complete len:239 (-),score=47.73 GHVO01052337.1:30-746(-)